MVVVVLVVVAVAVASAAVHMGMWNMGHGHQQPCDRDCFHNLVTLTFDLMTSGSMHAEQLL